MRHSTLTLAAARLALDRIARHAHPAGHFDPQGRFHLAAAERRPCCAAVRDPSRAHPLSHATHARTATHCAALFGADPLAVKLALYRIRRFVIPKRD